MNLGKQIDSLLRKDTSVYVKGLGVFRRIRTAATFDSSRNTYLPPISYIEFDSESTEGVDFISYLQQLEKIERQDAEDKLSASVALIIQEIQHRGVCLLDNLGSLVSFGSAFVFKPHDLSGFEFVAVEDVFLHPEEEAVEPQEEVSPEQVEETSSTVEADLSETVEDTTEEVEENVEVEEETEVNTENLESFSELPDKKDSNSYIYGLIAAFAILALGGLYYYVAFYNVVPPIPVVNIADKPIVNLDTSILDSDTSNQMLSSDTGENVIADQEENRGLEVDDSDKPMDPEVVDYKYIIIIGTHPTIEQANDEAALYHKKGHMSVRVLMPNLSKNKKRVIWDTYPTRIERDSALRVVRKNIKADAWGTEI